MEKKRHLGLVMTGGGARGAFQAGVLKRMGELKIFQDGRPSPFSIIAAASAGAVNGAAVAAGSHDFRRCCLWVAQLWSHLKTQNIFRSDPRSLVPMAAHWLQDLTLGGIFGGGHAHSLLDASPLADFLSRHLKTDFIDANVKKGHLRALCIAATSYSSGKTFLFVHGQEDLPLWVKTRRIAIPTKIEVDHIRASSAIPVVFQPVGLSTPYGTDYFGDGCLRMTAPLSPAIRLGADAIFAIGVRSHKAAADNALKKLHEEGEAVTSPPLAQVLGVALNAIFLDHLDTDVDHLMRLNQIVAHLDEEKVKASQGEIIRPIHVLNISPSVDLGELAGQFAHKLPTTVRYLLTGLGSKEAASYDLISYLLFDSEFTRALIDIGYNDADKRIDEIEEFLAQHL